MKTAHWILKYGFPIGIIILVISVLIYVYIYGRVFRIFKRLETRYAIALMANSYLFAFGLFLVFMAKGML